MNIDVTAGAGWNIQYGRSESSLRQALADWAHAFGWTVRQEVVVPNWGRLDLLLTVPGYGFEVAVELKMDLSKPAATRRAFQQADGYSKWLNSQFRLNHVLLCAPDVEHKHVPDIDALYTDVLCVSVAWLLLFLRTHDATIDARQNVVFERWIQAQHEAATFDAALDLLAKANQDADA